VTVVVNNSNSGEFWCRFPVGGGNTNSPKLLLLKFCHYQTTTTTSGLPPLLPFFAWAAPFLQFACFCVDFEYLDHLLQDISKKVREL